MKDKAKLEDEKAEKAKKEEEDKNVKGVPEFWLTIFKNVDMLQEMVQEADEPVLKKISDITVTFSDKPMVIYYYQIIPPKSFYKRSS
jgi:nucleosome assembly protein 1-like 1